MVRQAHQPFPRFSACRNRSQGDPSPSIFKKRPKCVKTADCHILTFTVCIFVRARFYAGNFPYRAWHIGPFRGWRRRGCLRHHLAVESAAVPDFRGDFCVFDVLWWVKRNKNLFFQPFYYIFSLKCKKQTRRNWKKC